MYCLLLSAPASQEHVYNAEYYDEVFEADPTGRMRLHSESLAVINGKGQSRTPRRSLVALLGARLLPAQPPHLTHEIDFSPPFPARLRPGLLQGRDGAIFAYGQTGSGKTFLMEGVLDASRTEWGIVPFVVRVSPLRPDFFPSPAQRSFRS